MYNPRPVNEALGKNPLRWRSVKTLRGVPLGAFLTTVAEFEIEYHQYLDAEGKLREPAPALAHDSAELIKMYRLMTLVRAFDIKAVNLQRVGKLGTYAACLGHEATHVAVGAAMRPEDVLAPVYREIGTQIWRGVKLSEILTYWGGDERGCDFSVPRQDFPWCIPIASQMLHGAGVAMAFKIKNEPRCSVTYIGDGGTSEGAFYEGINLAGARQLPAVFVVVNNGWAISVPIESQTATRTLAQKAIAAGIPGIQVDGNDVIAVRHVVGQALEKARSGGGPTVVEALTYRLSDHTTADDASRYRPRAQLDEAWAKEPLLRIRAYLTRKGYWDESQETALQSDCTRQIEAAVDQYLSAAKPTTDAMFDSLFAEPTPGLLEQRETARRYANGHGH
jgi:pyruvate dehydrogenase E1 component alpha subunit